MSGSTNTGMQQLIGTVNKLQDAFAATGMPFGLDLPQIAVVGGQSAGKSSVLENFVGKDFLPRGAGIVTRRPLILQMHTASEEYAEFQHQPGKKYTDFDEVRREIEADTDRETGTNKGISNKPINLRIYSPHVLDLTLVDLPGLTRVPVGDQPADIDVQIRNLVLEYVRKETTLILAVSPANSDLANSDALRMAREVDPEGKRTIGVLTKLDLMDEGTDAKDILDNKVLPIAKGYIGVVNRSQKDIDGKKDIRTAMEAEKQFFATHVAYRDISGRLGTPFLQSTLNSELGKHIQSTLGHIRTTLRNRMLDIKKELSKMEGDNPTGTVQAQMMKLVQEFGEDFTTDIEGLTADIDTGRLGGGAKINRLFYNEFAELLSLDKIPDNVLKREIAFAIKNIHGVRNGIFTPDMAFIATVTRVITQYRDPVKHCVTMVTDLLKDIVDRCSEAKLAEYKRLQEEVEFMVKEHVQVQEEVTQKALSTHVDAETAFMNTRHEDFIGVTGKDQLKAAEKNPESPEFTQSITDVKRKLENTNKAMHKSWLTLTKTVVKGSKSRCWFVLTTDSLSWFADQKEEDNIFMLNIKGGKIQVRFDKDKHPTKFTLFRPDARPLFLDVKLMELKAEGEEEQSTWISGLKNCGVFPESKEETKDEKGKEGGPSKVKFQEEESAEDTKTVARRSDTSRIRRHRETLKDMTKSMVDPDMERQNDVILLMVQSYLKIISKTVRDIVPKYIMLLLVNNTQKFVTGELLSRILTDSKTTADALMEATGERAQRKAELKRAYKSAEEALSIINTGATT